MASAGGSTTDRKRFGMAWAAGFFDGEGSTMIRRRRGSLSVSPRMAISQKGLPLLERFQKIFDGVGCITGPTDRGMYQWSTTGRYVTGMILAGLWPHLGSQKKDQARRVWLALTNHRDARWAGRLKALPRG